MFYEPGTRGLALKMFILCLSPPSSYDTSTPHMKGYSFGEQANVPLEKLLFQTVSLSRVSG